MLLHRTLLVAAVAACAAGCATAPGPDDESEPDSTRQWEPGEGGCFRAHLEEAIALNGERMSAYAELTDGASTRLSLALIAGEKLTLIAAGRFDERAEPWERAGVPVVCDLFVSMDEVPAFTGAVAPPAEPFEPHSGTALATRLGATYTLSGEDAVAEAVEAELDALAATPSYHCMERHVLESIARVAYYAPLHADLAADHFMRSPADLSRDILRAHIAGLPLATTLDKIAAPLQAAGVPILCNDVPPIGLP